MKPPIKESARGKDGDAERWITKDEVWHCHAKRMIRRKDGEPFRFPIRRRKKR